MIRLFMALAAVCIALTTSTLAHSGVVPHEHPHLSDSYFTLDSLLFAALAAGTVTAVVIVLSRRAAAKRVRRNGK
ncbi:MAG: hypothetical protein AAF732_21575 [Pseudomonadota bacterium]